MTKYFSILALCAATVGFAPGCGGWTRHVTYKAQTDLRCQYNSITLQWYQGGNVARAAGCGRVVYYSYGLRGGRDYHRLDIPLLRRASMEMRCPYQQLRLREVSKWNLRAVTGCGQFSYYIFYPAYKQWRMHSRRMLRRTPVTRAPAVTPAPTHAPAPSAAPPAPGTPAGGAPAPSATPPPAK